MEKMIVDGVLDTILFYCIDIVSKFVHTSFCLARFNRIIWLVHRALWIAISLTSNEISLLRAIKLIVFTENRFLTGESIEIHHFCSETRQYKRVECLWL